LNIFQKFFFSAGLSVDILLDKHRLERSKTENYPGCQYTRDDTDSDLCFSTINHWALLRSTIQSQTYPLLLGNFVSSDWFELLERLSGTGDWVVAQGLAESPSKGKARGVGFFGLAIDTFHRSDMLN
jgi:hypothetical protein